MRVVLYCFCVSLVAMISSVDATASKAADYKADAHKYYQEGEFRKAYKTYLKLAKSGDTESQKMVSQMAAKGEGTRASLTDAYAWSILAEEGKSGKARRFSDELLEQINDKDKARKKAAKLKKKYGREAIRKKAERMKKVNQKKLVPCTGSRVVC